jgi:hypothetical protein
MRRFLTEATSGDVADGSSTHIAGAAHCCIAAPEENEYEIRTSRPSGHDIDCHNRRGCAGWKWAWWYEVGGHRHLPDCIDGCFVQDCFADDHFVVAASANDSAADVGAVDGASPDGASAELPAIQPATSMTG